MAWETTKIKADVKAQAKELDATFTEIMQAGIQSHTTKSTTNGEEVTTNITTIEEDVVTDVVRDVVGDVVTDVVDDVVTQEKVVVKEVVIDEDGGVDSDDVEAIVENWIERNIDKLQRGQI
jgi:hypothetical protein